MNGRRSENLEHLDSDGTLSVLVDILSDSGSVEHLTDDELSDAIHHLSEMGLISSSTSDGRLHRIALTEAGQRIRMKVLDIVEIIDASEDRIAISITRGRP